MEEINDKDLPVEQIEQKGALKRLEKTGLDADAFNNFVWFIVLVDELMQGKDIARYLSSIEKYPIVTYQEYISNRERDRVVNNSKFVIENSIQEQVDAYNNLVKRINYDIKRIITERDVSVAKKYAVEIIYLIYGTDSGQADRFIGTDSDR